uniref:NADH dehydrogenase subunit 5 n=1 Tax=Allanaspides helonomus TaxID=91997 RepID=UPI002A83EC68|nr:NADH dehydrogenase subunit 5 [Allanaspides helonomus]WOR80947.1 NADH dehydrogenase subunit 5 [Allanaspides helonomus]WOR80960.1 NADH dehydrogenase subunit 5 [Allanaspides helonomus]
MSWGIIMHLSSMVFLLMSSISCIMISMEFLMSSSMVFIEWEIMNLNSVSIVMTLILDWMSMMFLSFVSFISSMVLFYSGEYMKEDKNYNRFMYLVLGFVLSMSFLIISPNLVSILLGWDGLGLTSYVLVIYYQNEKSANAGMLTALSNRIGDVAILLSISLMFSVGGWNFVFWLGDLEEKENFLGLVSLIILAGMTKSAQIPFSAWLPAAMAAPTPVSALVHSSTLVTAGVYLLIRFSAVIEGTSAQLILFLAACLTMFMAGLSANFEYDLKKIIALSTLSQLGVMMSIVALGYSELAFFHLLTHALFKALLFMCAGVLIHNMKDYQDIRAMGSLAQQMPVTSMLLMLANLALCGTPFLAGFYSKDLILEVGFMGPLSSVGLVLYILSTGLTVCYTGRLIYYSMSKVFSVSGYHSVSDESSVMSNPMMCLSLGAIFSGAGLSWLIFPFPLMICLSGVMKYMALGISLAGGVLGYLLNLVSETKSLKSLGYYSIVVVAGSMWFMPFLSAGYISEKFLKIAKVYQKVGDYGWYEYYGGQGGYKWAMNKSLYVQMFQDNSLKVYMLMFMAWVVVVVSLV